MSEWPKYYILVDRMPAAVDLMTWAEWFENFDNRWIARTDIDDRCSVSTVFLGVDHNFSGSEPLLFETMVFGGPMDEATWRYRTYAEAERGHAEAVALARIAGAKIKSIADAAGIKS